MTNFINTYGQVSTVLGAQWGDEGKGKLIDILAQEYEIIARATGGANAGHTIYIKDPENPGETKKHVFHLIPSGMFNPGKICVIGNGVVLHLETFMKEIATLEENGIQSDGRIFISDRAHILFEYHKIIDGLQEEMKGKKKVGTTKRGIGPCYTDKIRRNGIRIHDMLEWELFEEKYRTNLELFMKMYGKFDYDPDTELASHKKMLEKLKAMMVNGAYYLDKAHSEGKSILIEGANGALLDIDHGTYPYVTSSNASIGGVITGTGIPATKIKTAIGIMKAYTTRVGAGPFPTELHDDLGENIRQRGGEFGSTTGRPRRCGWYDAVVGRYSVIINGLTSINLTKLDVLDELESLKIAVAYKHNGQTLDGMPPSLTTLENVEVEYIEVPGWKTDISGIKNFEDLPENAKNYVLKIEELLGCKVDSIGVGVRREDMIFR